MRETLAFPPRVTVIVPNYNHRRFLSARFASIYAQTVRNIEIIFLDDGSNDGSANSFDFNSCPFPFRVINNAMRVGIPVVQWARGIEVAQGEFVWIAESDDVSQAGFLAALLKALQDAPSACMAYAQSLVIDEKGRVIDDHRRLTEIVDPEHWKFDFVACGRNEVGRFLSVNNPIPNVSACLFRRSSLVDMNWLNADLRLCGDWYAYSRLLAKHDIAFVAESLNFHRRHRQTVRYATARGWSRVEENYRVLSAIYDSFPEAHANRERACCEQFRAFTHALDRRSTGADVPPLALVKTAMHFDPSFIYRLSRYRSSPNRHCGRMREARTSIEIVLSVCAKVFPVFNLRVVVLPELRAVALPVSRGVYRIRSVNLLLSGAVDHMPVSCVTTISSWRACEDAWFFDSNNSRYVDVTSRRCFLSVTLPRHVESGAMVELLLEPVPFCESEPEADMDLLRRLARRATRLPLLGIWFRRIEDSCGACIHFWLWKFTRWQKRRTS